MTAPSRPSGLKTADAVIRNTKAILTGVQVITDGTNDATIVIYDNASGATGTALFKATVTGANDTEHFPLPDGGVYAENGLYADITTAGTLGYIVTFR